jgi:hypothetical protein
MRILRSLREGSQSIKPYIKAASGSVTAVFWAHKHMVQGRGKCECDITIAARYLDSMSIPEITHWLKVEMEEE